MCGEIVRVDVTEIPLIMVINLFQISLVCHAFTNLQYDPLTICVLVSSRSLKLDICARKNNKVSSVE